MTALTLGLARARHEVRLYARSGDTVFFTFAFPVLLLAVFSVAFSEQSFGSDADGLAVTAATYYLPGMIAAGILLSGVQGLAVDIATERGDGTLKRLAGTPLPVSAYVVGKAGQVLVTSAAQVVVLLVVARLAFGVTLPTDPERWGRLAAVYLLGITGSALLGVALSRVPSSGRAATAVVVPVTVVLQFVSGVYLPFRQLPDWLQVVASSFPLRWIAQGLRSAFLPEGFGVLERGGSWDLPLVLVVLAGFVLVGAVLARLTFRWSRPDA